LHRSENAEDVTLQYYDLEGRLNTKRELLKTYQSYLGRAKNIEEIMTVEKQIAELQNEIDWTGTRFRALADTVDYATIRLEISGSPSSAP
jgi:alpha-D-ribose 1-methylphosphonate 5-triphosphate synthase subunit PhnG